MSERIGERFQILEVLGRGGQATVYAVEDARRPGRQLALKQARDLETAALLRLEFERLRGLDHPGLVRGLEWLDADPGGPGLLCERIHGVPFDRALEAAGPVGSDARREQALAWAGDLLAALEVVHRAGWVHLDLKPANVLVGEGGPVLLDFALAARAGEVAARGTPGYAAPEVLAGWPVDRRADLYGLGALLVHALQGEAPAGDRCLDPGQAPAALAPLLAADRCARPSSAHEVLARWGRELPELEGGLPTLEAPWEGDGSRLAALARPGLTLVSGPAGSGRSRLLREAGFARRLDGARVVHVECATPAPGPWGPLSVLASRLGVEAGYGATAEGARARARVQISAGARRYASEGPCVFAFDDLERADPEALDLVVALVRALEGAPGVWLWLAWRAGDLPTALQRLVRTLPGAAQVELGPRARIERAPPPEGGPVRRLLEGLALLGRPLPPEELAAWDPALLASAGAASAGGWARSTPAGFVLQARVEPSAAVARELLALELEPPVAARVALVAQAPGAAEQALREARAALERGRLAQAANLAAALVARGGPRAAATQVLAEVELARGEDERGLALLEGLLDDEGAPADARAEAAALAARRRYRRAEDARALDLAERAEALGGRDASADLRCAIAHVRSLVAACADPQGYAPDLEQLAALRAAGASGDALAQLGTALGIVLYRSNRLSEAEPLLARASRDAAGPGARGWALLNLGVCLQRQARDADAERATAEARGLLEEAGDVVGVATADLESGLRLLRQSRYRGCAATLEPVLATFRALGDDARAAELELNLGAAWLRMGDLRRARGHLARAAAGLSEPGLRAFCAGDRALLAAEALEPDEARGFLEEAAAHARDADPFFALQARIQRAQVLALLGAGEEARDVAADALDAARARDARDLEPAAALALAEAALLAGDGARAAQAAEAAAASETERARARAAAARAHLLAGDVARARRAAEHALELAGGADDVFERLGARRALAAVLDAAGDAAGARRERARVAGAAAGRLPRIAAEVARALETPLSALEVELAGQDPSGGGVLARVVAGAPDAGHMLDLAVGLLVEATGAERGLLVLLDDALQPTETAARNMRDDELSGPASSYSRRLVHLAAEGGAPIVIRDALVDPRFTEAESVATLALRSVLAIPIAAGGAPLAVLYLDDRTQPGRFGEDALELARRLTEELAPALRLARERASLRRDVAGLRSRVAEAEAHAATREIVGESAPIRRLRVEVARAARTALPVLIEGESGSGKELIARAIHAGSARGARAFVAESCAAVVDELLESELFGHVRGAFTGADRDREGIFAQASGGTLFLDEVNSMSPSMQAKLLRVLQEGVVRPVGAESTRRVDVRVIAASNEPLAQCVQDGRFREDLYYRLAVMPLRAPSLRERPDDVPLLLEHALRKHAEGEALPQVTDAALRALVAHPWPGNVRELENAARRLLALRVPRVLVRHLPPEVRAAAKDARPGQDPTSAASELTLPQALERLERDLIARALRRCQGNVSQAARQLGLERTKLTRRIKRLGLED